MPLGFNVPYIIMPYKVENSVFCVNKTLFSSELVFTLQTQPFDYNLRRLVVS